MKILVWMCNVLYWLGIALTVGGLLTVMFVNVFLGPSEAELRAWDLWMLCVSGPGVAMAFFFNPSWRPFGIGRSTPQPL